MKSMTGFGRAELEASFGKLIVEVQSVNRKYFELYISLPKEFSRFENEIRKQVAEQNLRGQVSVKIHLFPNASALEALLPDPAILGSLKKKWEQICETVGYGKQVIDFPFLVEHALRFPRIEVAEDEACKPIANCLSIALKALDEMKQKEGKALAKDIELRLKAMARILLAIEQLSPKMVEKLRQKLKERMEELLKPGVDLDERLLRETALFAERIDISEEITRFRSHLSQYEELLKSKEGPMGRKMDFLTQEMGREINTIGSKSMEAKIAHLVVDIKGELEKVREQIQNIE